MKNRVEEPPVTWKKLTKKQIGNIGRRLTLYCRKTLGLSQQEAKRYGQLAMEAFLSENEDEVDTQSHLSEAEKILLTLREIENLEIRLELARNRIDFKAIRKAAGLTQEKWAHLLGHSVRTIVAWELGQSQPKSFKGMHQAYEKAIKGHS